MLNCQFAKKFLNYEINHLGVALDLHIFIEITQTYYSVYIASDLDNIFFSNERDLLKLFECLHIFDSITLYVRIM